MRYAFLVVALLLTGCGTVNERTLEYCDTTTKTIIGIPYNKDANCTGISNSETGTAISLPESNQLPAQ